MNKKMIMPLPKESRDFLFRFLANERTIVENPSTVLRFLQHLEADINDLTKDARAEELKQILAKSEEKQKQQS